MRIALVHYSCAPVIGGVETIVAAHARLFAAAGHDVRLVVRRGGESDSRVVHLRSEEPLAELRAALFDCDLVVAHNLLTMPFDMPFTAALQTLAREDSQHRRHYVAWVHDLAACSGDYPLPFHELPWTQLTARAFGFDYVAVSEHRAQQFAALTGSAARVIPNGVDPAALLGLSPAIAEFARAAALFERDVILFQPARLLPRKNIELGLAVAAELRRRGRDVAYLVTAAPNPFRATGDRYAEILKEWCCAAGLTGHAFFLNENFPVTSSNITELYALADVVFLPSLHEGFALPVLEAALHRLPVFYPDRAPMNALLNTALHPFSPDSTAPEIATSIERILDLSAPHQARREVLRRYAWPIIDRDFLRPLLAESRPTS